MKSAKKKKKRKTDLAPGTLDFPRIMPQPTNTIYMSLGFASGTLSCFIFQHAVPGRPENRKQRTRRSASCSGEGRPRRWRGSSGEAPGGQHASAGRLGWPGESSWRPSHGSRRRRWTAPGGGGAPAMVGAGNGAQCGQKDTAVVLRHLAWAKKA